MCLHPHHTRAAVHRGHIGARSAGAPGRAIGVRAPPALRRGVCPGHGDKRGAQPQTDSTHAC